MEDRGDALSQLERHGHTHSLGADRPPRLSDATLSRAAAAVLQPDYARAETRIGIVHFGPGAFHRAHQAYYFDRLLKRDSHWAISAVSLRTTTLRDALAPQDGLYTLLELDATPTARIIGSTRELLVANEAPQAVSARLGHPDTRLVTMTVTEKGYCLGGTGQLDLDHPDIRHDLAHPDTPRSLVGWLVHGLARRRALGLSPFLVVCCDNLANNGPTLAAAVSTFAALTDPGLANWIDERTRFPRTMVDSITPATDDALRERVLGLSGLRDAWPIQRERFLQWVVEATDVEHQPDWASVGVTVSRDVSTYERAKLRLLNGAHSTLAYVGSLAGLETVTEAMACAPLRTFVERLMLDDIEPTLNGADAAELARYRESIVQRFENPAMRHLLAQIAWDGSQKLPIRILSSVVDALDTNRSVSRLAVPIAAWMHFVRRQASAARPIVDPLQSELLACAEAATGAARHDLPLFLALPGVFAPRLRQDERFKKALATAYDRIADGGVLAALSMID